MATINISKSESNRFYYEQNKEEINEKKRIKKMQINYKRLLNLETEGTLTEDNEATLNYFKSLPKNFKRHHASHETASSPNFSDPFALTNLK